MENVTRTAYGVRIQVLQSNGYPFYVEDHTTLNQKHGILADVLPDEGKYPIINCFAIGKGGHLASSASDGTPTTVQITHDYSDPCLYDQIPFVIRDLDDDLSPSEREKYRHRVKKYVSGKDRWCYYLKTLEAGSGNIIMQHNVTVDGISKPTEFVPTIENLSPVKPTINNIDVKETSKQTLTVTSVRGGRLNAAEIAEVRNACDIMFGDPNLAIISEVAIVSSVDKQVEIPLHDGTTAFMKEAITAQCYFFVKAKSELMPSSSVFSVDIDYGSTEPVRDAE